MPQSPHCYPVIGALIARLWYKEKISSRSAMGMTIIIFGGVVIYGPGLFGEMDGSNPYAWLGYVGIMSAIDWGTGDAVASRAMDVSDPDVGIHCRFTFEILFWGLLILPALGLFMDFPIVKLITGHC